MLEAARTTGNVVISIPRWLASTESYASLPTPTPLETVAVTSVVPAVVVDDLVSVAMPFASVVAVNPTMSNTDKLLEVKEITEPGTLSGTPAADINCAVIFISPRPFTPPLAFTSLVVLFVSIRMKPTAGKNEISVVASARNDFEALIDTVSSVVSLNSTTILPTVLVFIVAEDTFPEASLIPSTPNDTVNTTLLPRPSVPPSCVAFVVIVSVVPVLNVAAGIRLSYASVTSILTFRASVNVLTAIALGNLSLAGLFGYTACDVVTLPVVVDVELK